MERKDTSSEEILFEDKVKTSIWELEKAGSENYY